VYILYFLSLPNVRFYYYYSSSTFIMRAHHSLSLALSAFKKYKCVYAVFFSCCCLVQLRVALITVNTYTHIHSFIFFSFFFLLFFFLLSDVVGFLLLFSTSIIIKEKKKNPDKQRDSMKNDFTNYFFI
jgi:hypothetical protein